MSSCCAVAVVEALPCPLCGGEGPVVGVASVRPHRSDATDGAWQHCPTLECPVVFYLDGKMVDADEVITQVAHKATDQPVPVCFCFAYTSDDLVADAAAHDGVSTFKAAIKLAVADGHCACEHLNPSTKCCLADVYRTLKAATVTVPATAR